MADLSLEAVSPKVAFSTSTITLLQIVAPTNQRLKIREWSVSFDGTSNTAAPIKVEVVRQTTAGTMSALTLVKNDASQSETIQSSAQHTASAEPTTTDVMKSELVHPQQGFCWQAPFGGEIKVKGGERIGIRLVTPGAGANAEARFTFEE